VPAEAARAQAATMPSKDAEGARLHVVQVRSAIGAKPKHKGTLRALGLGRIGRSNVLPDRPEVKGMLARVAHLVQVAEVAPPSSPAEPKSPRRGRARQAVEARAGAVTTRGSAQETEGK
jgi:large subunit ribosomal protein L30